ncbi:MAG: hypothetical protein BWY50_02121 [Spirochaetes bacterium ADurb.Bin315]|nr:MAG: hypothetical protein BWY50_02121 [Spirochaetes bacterium ADurb.Bin315]
MVVHLSLLLIRKDIIRLGCFLEAVLGRLVTLIAIGVIGDRKFAICFFNFIQGSGLLHPKDLIIISFRHSFLVYTIMSAGADMMVINVFYRPSRPLVYDLEVGILSIFHRP